MKDISDYAHSLRRRFARGEHGHGEHRGLGGHSRGGRRGRPLGTGDLRFVLLRLIAEQPRHGYEIIRAIEEKTGGAYSPSPGVIYPTLTMLAELGHVVASEAEGGRKLHTITPEGEAALAEGKAAVEDAFRRVESLGETRDDSNAPPIVRAMENLKLSLRLRLGRGKLDPAEITAIAAALDAAAVAIEQS
ncbi:MAG: PadR family transcriptional regulator [Acetobacteraceae bacterium]